MGLNEDLVIYGYQDRIEIFHEIMSTVYYKKFYKRFSTVERLLCNPLAALAYVEEVRCLAKFWMPIDELLAELINIRKSGVLKNGRWAK